MDRLRRHLRALAAVNRQLFAQLEGTGGRSAAPADEGDLLAEGSAYRPTLTNRRSAAAGEMVDRLTTAGGASAFLVTDSERRHWAVEGQSRRRVKARMIYEALAGVLEERSLPDAELDRLPESVAVEVMEGPSGPAFVVVGGRAYPLRGLPLPYPISQEQAARFSRGSEIRVRAAAPATGVLRRAAGRLRRVRRRG